MVPTACFKFGGKVSSIKVVSEDAGVTEYRIVMALPVQEAQSAFQNKETGLDPSKNDFFAVRAFGYSRYDPWSQLERGDECTVYGEAGGMPDVDGDWLPENFTARFVAPRCPPRGNGECAIEF